MSALCNMFIFKIPVRYKIVFLIYLVKSFVELAKLLLQLPGVKFLLSENFRKTPLKNIFLATEEGEELVKTLHSMPLEIKN